jgi:hypothetical protein
MRKNGFDKHGLTSNPWHMNNNRAADERKRAA